MKGSGGGVNDGTKPQYPPGWRVFERFLGAGFTVVFEGRKKAEARQNPPANVWIPIKTYRNNLIWFEMV
jgi:hypothetical protein